MGENSPSDGIGDYYSFSNAMKKFPLNKNCISDPILKAIFEEYKLPNSEEQMSYKNFVCNILNAKELNDFYNFK
jgi:hypothetical protein